MTDFTPDLQIIRAWKDVPAFDTTEAEIHFWSTRQLDQRLMQTSLHRSDVRESTTITLRFDPRHYPGGTFTIEVRNFNPNHAYIQKAWLNGVPLSRWWITHAELTKGGSLLFELGPNPSPDWGSFSNLPPP